MGSNWRTMSGMSAGSDALETVGRADVEEVVALVGSDLRLRAGGGAGADLAAADEAARLLAAVPAPDALALAATGGAAAFVVVAALVVGAWAAVAASNATESRSRSLFRTFTYCWSAV